MLSLLAVTTSLLQGVILALTILTSLNLTRFKSRFLEKCKKTGLLKIMEILKLLNKIMEFTDSSLKITLFRLKITLFGENSSFLAKNQAFYAVFRQNTAFSGCFQANSPLFTAHTCQIRVQKARAMGLMAVSGLPLFLFLIFLGSRYLEKRSNFTILRKLR